MGINLGFSTSCFHRSLTAQQALNFLSSNGCKTVELSFLRTPELLDSPLPRKKDLEPFDYVSIHAPVYAYCNERQTQRILNLIRDFHLRIRALDLVVFHPDIIRDFSVFENQEFPVAFENVDNRKRSHKIPSDLLVSLEKVEDARMVLDVNHAFTHDIDDADCRLTAAFWRKLHPWISQVHLSGYAPPKHNHWPLFKTRQDFIIRSIENLEVPIIVESVLQPNELVQERDYILETIGNR